MLDPLTYIIQFLFIFFRLKFTVVCYRQENHNKIPIANVNTQSPELR